MLQMLEVALQEKNPQAFCHVKYLSIKLLESAILYMYEALQVKSGISHIFQRISLLSYKLGLVQQFI